MFVLVLSSVEMYLRVGRLTSLMILVEANPSCSRARLAERPAYPVVREDNGVCLCLPRPVRLALSRMSVCVAASNGLFFFDRPPRSIPHHHMASVIVAPRSSVVSLCGRSAAAERTRRMGSGTSRAKLAPSNLHRSVPSPSPSPSVRCASSSNGSGAAAAVEDPDDRKNVWALDFDGVVCDSCGESALSAWQAATELWPDVFTTSEALAKKDQIVEDMRTVRPVVETGYENIVQVRCLLEGVTPDDMLANWSTMLPEYMKKWDLDRQALVELFGKTRDDWIARDLDGWLALNRIYAGVPEAMDQLMVEHEVYIVTTKQARFTEMILERMAFIDFPSDRIFSQTVSGKPKSEVLQMLQERHPGTRYHFVEDKYSTLKKVEKEGSLDAWNLYLVDWGYNVQAERDEAEKSDRINMVDIAQFRSVIDAF